MGKFSRDKGIRVEREIIDRHKELGVYCQRAPLSGGVQFRGATVDIDIYAFGRAQPPMISEVKSRAEGQGFKMIEKWLGDDAEVLFLQRDYATPIVVLPWSSWAGLLDAIRR